MPRFARTLSLALVLLLSAAGRAAAQDASTQPTVVIVVRHAEKQAEGSDPALTEAGAARARALVNVARDAGVGAVYTSEARRTKDTAQPLAAALGLTPVEARVDRARMAAYPGELAARVLAEQRGKTVLVVSHSNFVPQIVTALGGAAIAPMTEAEYDHLFIVVVPPSGPARTLRASYGVPLVPTRAPAAH